MSTFPRRIVLKKSIFTAAFIFLSSAVSIQSGPSFAANNGGKGSQNSSSPSMTNVNSVQSIPNQLIEKLLKSIDQKQAAVYLRFKGSFQPLEIEDFSATVMAAMDTKGKPITIDTGLGSNMGSIATSDFNMSGSLDVDQRIIFVEIKPANSTDLKEFVGKLRFIDSKTLNKGSIFISVFTPQIAIQNLYLDEVNFRMHLPEEVKDTSTLQNKLFKLVLNCKGRHQARNIITRTNELNELEACEFELSDKFYFDFKEKLPKLNF